ncbi:MAG: hypothetical protein M1830_005196 [Pleopsidium flavum]|nr:MAG: hypothetical protein M1830_005196 [Pleopsidium flavum]
MEGIDVREIEMETELCGPTSNLPTANPHTLTSILSEMTQACTDIEAEIAAIDQETQSIIDQIKGTVGGLSDLRYGRLNKSAGTANKASEEILLGMERLEELCSGRGQA